MKKRRPETQPIDPADLAAGYLFPELFAAEPFAWHSQEAEDSPFQPTAHVQHTIPDLPPVDWDHMRRKQAEQRRKRRHR
jgi:hypothetical protein